MIGSLHTLHLPPRSRGSTLRSKSRPLGRSDSKAVEEGNLLAGRALLLVLIIAAKGGFWVLEQPSTSIMEWHPMFQAIIKLLPTMRRKAISMSKFGAPTKKRTLLYSGSHSWKSTQWMVIGGLKGSI